MRKLKTLAFLFLVFESASAKKGRGTDKRKLERGKKRISDHRKVLAFNQRDPDSWPDKGLEWNDDMYEQNSFPYRLPPFFRPQGKGKGKGKGAPTVSPTSPPSKSLTPTSFPSPSPSFIPTQVPSSKPSISPTLSSNPSNSPAPSNFPSLAPSVGPSSIPSLAPSKDPSGKPSIEPSESPSVGPSMNPSMEPSNSPSRSPSLEPSKSPSVQPSQNPSVEPSSSPSKLPSLEPSKTLSDLPSAKPSSGPSTLPSPEPSVGPSSIPSLEPSNKPTIQPSNKPSLNPSSSVAPSSQPSTFPTKVPLVATDFSNGTVSTCIGYPTQSGIVEDQALAFKYNLYIPTGYQNATDAALTLEHRLHIDMVDQFLLCNFDGLATFFVISVSSNPEDTVTSDECDTSNDPIPLIDSDCVVVIAQLGMEAFFPSSRRLQRTKADEDVLDATAFYLESSMTNGKFIGGSIVQASFQGFININIFDSNGENSDASSNGRESSINGQNSSSKKSDIAVSSSILGSATCCLLLVAFLSIYQRNNRRESYLKNLDDLSDLSTEKDNLSPNVKIHVVNDEFNDMFSLDEVSQSEKEELPPFHPNVHYCASATCSICRNRALGPKFVTINLSDEDKKDLEPKPCISSDENKRNYMAPDTLIL